MATRERKCAHCGGQFGYEIGRGRDRIHCSDDCRIAHSLDRARANPPTARCAAPDCENAVRSSGATLCEMHYGRLRRNGRLDRNLAKGFTKHSGGYIVRHVQGHPLATPGQVGRIYEHRVVFYEQHGDGPFVCYHCGVEVTWAGMHVDHLNDRPDDNAPDNLVASCPTCNQWRGKHKMVATQRAAGLQLTALGRTMCLNEWATETGLPRTTLGRRLKDGWTPERIVGTPSGPTGRKVR